MSKAKRLPKRNCAASIKRIQNAAIDVFAQHGYKGATTRMIAKKAGLNAALIARYFGGKEKLFMTLVHNQVDSFVEPDLSQPLLPTLADEIIQYVIQGLRHLENNLKAFRIIIAHALIDTKLRRSIQKEVMHKFELRLKKRLTELRAVGLIDPSIDLSGLASGASSYMIGQSIFHRLIGDRPIEELEKEISTLVHSIFKNMAQPLQRESGSLAPEGRS